MWVRCREIISVSVIFGVGKSVFFFRFKGRKLEEVLDIGVRTEGVMERKLGDRSCVF